MRSKKMISLITAVVLVLTSIIGCVAVSAETAEQTIKYSFNVTSSEKAAAFDGTVAYPSDSLSVKSVSVLGGGQYNYNSGTIYFNTSNASEPFDFSQGTDVITVVFKVNGDYDVKDISAELVEFYSLETIGDGNIPFSYKNIVDSERVSSGYVDIDAPQNSYTDPDDFTYTVVYEYTEAPEKQAVLTKTVKSPSEKALTVANFGLPYIENPYFKNYKVNSAEFESDSVINAQLSCQQKLYSVSVNGTTTDSLVYMQAFTIKEDEEKDFLIDGVKVASGKFFSFYVTGNTSVATEQATGELSERASIVRSAFSISDDSEGNPRVKIELLATVSSAKFDHMGVAFALSERTEEDIANAVGEVREFSGTYNKIAVHNSSVDSPNRSGQYQFIYAPYFAASKLSSDKTIYFYTYSVGKDGSVTVSKKTEVKMANVLA